MGRYSLDDLSRGGMINCENCSITATVQDEGQLPRGWFVVQDSQAIAVLFCTATCILHYLAKKLKGQSKPMGVVEKIKVF